MNRITAVLFVLVFIVSCRAPRTVVVEVLSDPPGARVIRDGEFIGVTPVSFDVEQEWNSYYDAWLGKYIRLEAIPTREMMDDPGVSGSVQARRIQVEGARDEPFRVFFDMGLSRSPDVEADINVDVN